MNFLKSQNPCLCDELPPVPTRRQSLGLEVGAFSETSSAPKTTTTCFYHIAAGNREKNMAQLLEDTARTSNPTIVLSPPTKPRQDQAQPGATRRSAAPQRGTKKADYLKTLSKSLHNERDIIEHRSSTVTSQRRARKNSLSSSRDKSPLGSISEHGGARRCSYGNLPTIEEFRKFNSQYNSVEDSRRRSARKVSSCEDVRRRERRSPRSRNGSNASFDLTASPKTGISPSCVTPKGQKKCREPIQNSVSEASLFHGEAKQCEKSSLQTNSPRTTQALLDCPSTPPLYFPPPIRKHKSESDVDDFSDFTDSTDFSYEEENGPLITPSSSRGIFDGAPEPESLRVPIRQKSEPSMNTNE